MPSISLHVAGAPLLAATGLKKSYFRGTEVPVLRGVDLSIDAGEFVSITGQSGSGKSTLLHLLGGLDQPDAGEIQWKGSLVDPRNRRERDRFRNEMVGYVFQMYHLLPELTALENVLLPQYIRCSFLGYLRRRTELRREASALLERVGLGARGHHKPSELSGGEMQRAAIARALMGRPELLLADEPTGNLDAETGRGIHQLLRELNKTMNLAVLMVTHDQSLADSADRRLRLVLGSLETPGASSAAA